MRNITLSKGGTNERTIPISELVIPDLWHIHLYLKKEFPGEAQSVLDCWHIAHDLKRTLEDESR